MSYTQRETKKLIQLQADGLSIEQLCVRMNRTKRSIIAKLTAEGLYSARGYRDKQGNVPVTKLAICTEIEKSLDVSLMDLSKAPKGTLQTLYDCITTLDNTNKELLEQATVLANSVRVLKDRKVCECPTKND